jgi:8-oxo-dGTP diphosphatase
MDHSLASAASSTPPVRTGPRDPGDAWVEGDRGRFWGRFGAAGVLAYDPAKGVLLQHRAVWSHNGGTWGLPGGALHEGEDAVAGALREAWEEAAVPAGNVEVLFTSVLDLDYWSYTTVVVLVTEPFEPVISDPESIELLWIPLAEVDGKDLHPGFAASWPELRERIGTAA